MPIRSGSRNLDLGLLRALVAIVDSGSFSIAAARLGRTQSAISMQIKRLADAALERFEQRM
ncbi:LysR family transcriptional regulator [Aromatoleum evansii]|uniref:LysR family transcriptional regulator n=1 Tax=Aromatoleum evansii TaxID=59406 RepID=A0ABZ1ARE2_AROEV|nr:LysR family transcriptional regulator [Aromatoleum evansii]